LPRPASSTLLPYTTLFRSVGGTRRGIKCLHAHYANHIAGGDDVVGRWVAERIEPIHSDQRGGRVAAIDQGTNSCRLTVLEPGPRSEEHTSELQSRSDLVCR